LGFERFRNSGGGVGGGGSVLSAEENAEEKKGEREDAGFSSLNGASSSAATSTALDQAVASAAAAAAAAARATTAELPSYPSHEAYQGVVDLRSFGVRVAPRLKGRGLSEFSLEFLGKAMDKAEQFGDWSCRPLRASQLEYASLDAWVLVMVWERILERRRGIEEGK